MSSDADPGRVISCAVLAGGASRRMGTDKALVDFGGRSLVLHVVERLAELTDDIFVVAKRPLDLPVRCVIDETDEQTPVAGIIAALRYASHPHVFVCACDMPFVSATRVRELASLAAGVDAVVPLRDGRLEPMHAIWSTSIADTLAAELANGERAVHRILANLDILTVEMPGDDPTFANVNTPEDLERFKS